MPDATHTPFAGPTWQTLYTDASLRRRLDVPALSAHPTPRPSPPPPPRPVPPRRRRRTHAVRATVEDLRAWRGLAAATLASGLGLVGLLVALYVVAWLAAPGGL